MIPEKDGSLFRCKRCREIVGRSVRGFKGGIFRKHKYCSSCGQKVDWSKEKEPTNG